MFAPITPKTERSRIRTEREYREWQQALRSNVPVKRFKNKPGILSRLVNRIRRATPPPVPAPQRVEQNPC